MVTRRGIKREQEEKTENMVSEEEYFKQYEIIKHLTNKNENLTNENKNLVEKSNKYKKIAIRCYMTNKNLEKDAIEQKSKQYVDHVNFTMLEKENDRNKQTIQEQQTEIIMLRNIIDQMVVDDITNFTNGVCNEYE